MKRIFLIGLALAPGCAPQNPSYNPWGFLASPAPAPVQRCELIEVPYTLPSGADLLKPTVTQLSAVEGEGTIGEFGAYALVEVQFDSTGTRTKADLLEGTFTPDAVRRLIDSLVDKAPASAETINRAWGVVIRTTALPRGQEIEVHRMEYCACAIINKGEFQRGLNAALAERGRFGIPSGDWTVQFDIETDETGRTLDIRMSQSSGIPDLDRMVYSLTRQLRIAPPLLNRRPLPGRTRVPVTLKL